MKRKLQTIFLTLVASIASVFAIQFLSACKNNDKDFEFTKNADGNSYSVIGKGCTGDVKIPSEYKGLPVTTFEGFVENNENITSITIPDSITEIKAQFYTDFENYTQSNPLNTLSKFNSLTSITVSEDNTVFYSENNCIIEKESKTLILGCKTSIIPIDGSVIRIENAFNGCQSLTNISIPDSIIEIGNNAFYGCDSLTNITIPNNVIEIGGSAFYGCSGLTNITIPNNVIEIGDSAFYGCSGLTNITIPNNVIEIGYSAFYGCKSLNKLTFGEGVSKIGAEAFANCTALTEINFNSTNCQNTANIHDISGEGVFSNAGKDNDGITLNIGANVKRIPACLFATKDFKVNLASNIISVVFAEDSQCENIAYAAFLNCTSLENITLPNNLTLIGEYAFSGTAIKSISIPEKVTYLGNNVFDNCSALTNVTFQKTWNWYYWLNRFNKVRIDEDLSNPETSAKLLTNKYKNYALDRGQ